jgi:hypothetical protein
VLDAPHSNIAAFLSRDTCASSTQLNRGIFNKMSVSPLKNPNGQAVFLYKTTSIVTGTNLLDAPASNRDDFLSRDTCTTSPQLNRPIWNKMRLSPPRKT